MPMSDPKNYSQLIIQVSLNEFAFLTKDILTQEQLEFHRESIQTAFPIEEQLETIFSKYEKLRLDYDEVLVLHNNALNTFVPQSIFDENNLGAYLQYSTKVFSTDFFAFDEMDLYQMNNVYVPYIAINNFLLDKFGAFTYQNINTALVTHLLSTNSNNSETVVYAYLQDTHFELIVIKNDQLLLFNSFAFQTAEDFIYYILFVYEQLELNPDTHPLVLLGAIDSESKFFKIAYKYIRELSIKKLHINTNIQTSTPNHFNLYYTLFQSWELYLDNTKVEE